MTDRELMQQALDVLETLLGWQSLAPHEDQENAKAVAFQLRARLSKCDRCGKVNPAEIHTCTPKSINMENFVGSGKPLVPVCWMNANDIDKTDWKVWAHGKPTVSMPLFASPPQRESGCGECGKKASDGWALYCVECSKPMRDWVGLTDEEIRQSNKESWVTTQAWESAVWWAEKKLKEKNG